MAYVDHTFSLTDDGDDDEDGELQGTLVAHNRFPLKDIAFAAMLLLSGALCILLGLFLIFLRKDPAPHRAPGLFFAIFGGLLFLPGFYYTRIAYYAYSGYKGFTLTDIPTV